MRDTVAELRRRLAQLELDHLASASALDRLQIGVIVADHDGLVLHANRMVHVLSARADPPLIVIGPDRKARLETSWFRDRVAPLLRPASGRRPAQPMITTYPSQPGGHRLHSLVAPLAPSGHAPAPHAAGAVTIFVSDPDGTVDTSQQALRSLFAATRTEARVAALLTNGLTLREVAARLGIAPATARWHVKHLLVKTGTKSQRHLACVLLAGVANIRED